MVVFCSVKDVGGEDTDCFAIQKLTDDMLASGLANRS